MHAYRRFVAASLLLIVPVAAAGQDPSPSARFEKDIQAYEAADRESPPPSGAVLFVGASGIRLWKTLASDFADQHVINRGFGGSHMADSVYFADRIVIPYKPRLIVIQAGGNDINAGKTAEQVHADFKAFVAKVRAALPDTRIAFLSINPSPKRWAQREEQQKANRLIRDDISHDKNLTYIQLWEQFLGSDGLPRPDLYVDDQLHQNEAGYKIRADVVRPYLALSSEGRPMSAKRLRHVVMYKFKDDCTPAQVQEVVEAFRALPDKVDTIVDFECGTNVSQEGKSEGFTHLFLVTFRDTAGLSAYLAHPAHDAYVQVVKNRREKVVVFDYWSGE